MQSSSLCLCVRLLRRWIAATETRGVRLAPESHSEMAVLWPVIESLGCERAPQSKTKRSMIESLGYPLLNIRFQMSQIKFAIWLRIPAGLSTGVI